MIVSASFGRLRIRYSPPSCSSASLFELRLCREPWCSLENSYATGVADRLHRRYVGALLTTAWKMAARQNLNSVTRSPHQNTEKWLLNYCILGVYILQVLTNVVGALGELAGDPECCLLLLRGGGVTTLIQLLRRTSDKLLLNVTHALGSCAADEDALVALLKQDGLRLLWSHLKNPNCRIQASAANAICTCLQQESVSVMCVCVCVCVCIYIYI